MTKTLTAEYLKSLSACNEACTAFAEQKERDTVKVLKLLVKLKKWDWSGDPQAVELARRLALRLAVFVLQNETGEPLPAQGDEPRVDAPVTPFTNLTDSAVEMGLR